MTGTDSKAVLVLYITGDAPRSRRARTNLERALTTLDLPTDVVREVDLIRTPGEAVQHGIFATPALIRNQDSDQPAVLYGDLSDDRQLQRFLAELADDRPVEGGR